METRGHSLFGRNLPPLSVASLALDDNANQRSERSTNWIAAELGNAFPLECSQGQVCHPVVKLLSYLRYVYDSGQNENGQQLQSPSRTGIDRETNHPHAWKMVATAGRKLEQCEEPALLVPPPGHRPGVHEEVSARVDALLLSGDLFQFRRAYD